MRLRWGQRSEWIKRASAPSRQLDVQFVEQLVELVVQFVLVEVVQQKLFVLMIHLH